MTPLEERQSAPGSTLLHNMSAPSKSVVRHEGQTYGKRLLFAIPASITGQASPSRLLALLDGVEPTDDDVAAAAELTARLNARAPKLQLPPAAAVAESIAPRTSTSRDLLTIMTVLAKSSAHVYLRDKEPILENIQPGRRVALILPPDWRSK